MRWEQEHGGHEDKDEQNSPMHKSLLPLLALTYAHQFRLLSKWQAANSLQKNDFYVRSRTTITANEYENRPS
jgi:hypothetical protein